LPEAFPHDFLLEDYKLKVEYFSNHLSRMWTRFNFLLTIDSALFALFATRENLSSTTRLLFIFTGLVLSVLWFFIGGLDIHFTAIYRSHIKKAHCLLLNGCDVTGEDKPPYVGDVGETIPGISPLNIMARYLPLGFSVVWVYWLFYSFGKN
jgi:hypothetical protein